MTKDDIWNVRANSTRFSRFLFLFFFFIHGFPRHFAQPLYVKRYHVAAVRLSTRSLDGKTILATFFIGSALSANIELLQNKALILFYCHFYLQLDFFFLFFFKLAVIANLFFNLLARVAISLWIFSWAINIPLIFTI